MRLLRRAIDNAGRIARPLMRTGLLLGLIAWGLVPTQMVYAQEDAEDVTLEAMCRIGLSNSAIGYVSARRELAGGDPSQVARWTQRLMECQAWAALHKQAQADVYWAECGATFESFREAFPDSGRLPWLQWQQARCLLLRIQAEVAEHLAAPANPQPRVQALERIRQLLSALAALDSELKRLQPLAARQAPGRQTPASATLPPAEQFAKLSVDAGLLACEAWLMRARLYEVQSADRIAAATEVDRLATEILARTEPQWPSRSQLLVALAVARLELGQAAQAVQALEQLSLQAQQSSTRLRAATAAIEFLSRQAARPADAALPAAASRARSLLEYLQQHETGPEVALAEIEVGLAELQGLQGETRQAALTTLLERVQRVGSEYGDYWRSRGEALLVHSAGATSPGESTANLELLKAEVRQMLAGGQTAEARERLLKWRDTAVAAGDGATALQVARQAAALWQREEQWQQAADAIRPVAEQFADLPAAPEAHLQAAFCISQALRADAQDVSLTEQYEQILRRQVELWPDAATTDDAENWLASWLVGQQRHSELAELYQQRAIASSDHGVRQRSLLNWLGQTLQLADPAAVHRQIAASAALRSAGKWSSRSQASNAERDVAGADFAAQVELVELVAEAASSWPTAAEQSDQLQRLAGVSSSATNAPWLELAQVVRWLAAIRSGQAAEEVSSDLLAWQPQQLPASIRLGIAPSLIEAIDETPWSEHAAWARRLKLDPEWQAELLAASAPRLQAAGYRLMAWREDVSTALEGLRGLAEQSGRRGGELELQFAHALADSGPNRWQDSTQVAARLIANSAAGSPLHLAARWRWCKNQILLGKPTQAQQASKLLLATQPPDSSVWKQRFEQLAR